MIRIKTEYIDPNIRLSNYREQYIITIHNIYDNIIIHHYPFVVNVRSDDIVGLVSDFQKMIIERWTNFSSGHIYFNIRILRSLIPDQFDSIEFDYGFYSRIIKDLYEIGIFL